MRMSTSLRDSSNVPESHSFSGAGENLSSGEGGVWTASVAATCLSPQRAGRASNPNIGSFHSATDGHGGGGDLQPHAAWSMEAADMLPAPAFGQLEEEVLIDVSDLLPSRRSMDEATSSSPRDPHVEERDPQLA